MFNKKGEMTVATVIAIVLAVLVLALLVYGLTTGTVPFFGTIDSFGGGSVNVQQVVQSCQIACATQSTFDWCNKQRSIVAVKADGALEDGGVKIETCNALGNLANSYGLRSCDAIKCDGI